MWHRFQRVAWVIKQRIVWRVNWCQIDLLQSRIFGRSGPGVSHNAGLGEIQQAVRPETRVLVPYCYKPLGSRGWHLVRSQVLQHRPGSLFLLPGFIIAVVPALVFGQVPAPDANERPVFKANARAVVVDVVVTGKDGKPVQGLHQEDFQTDEDGHPQHVTFFEEHTGAQTVPVGLPKLPPNVFTNIPQVTATGGTVTVLLLDNLNTALQDQSGTRARMLNYLRAARPGSRFAIFALGRQLRYVQGFTDDPALLAAALKDPKRGAAAELPPFPLGNYQTEQELSRLDQRVRITLQAFEDLANYLAGIPGRKTVVWFSGSFPLVTLNPDPLKVRDYRDQVKKTDAVLAAAQVALYPIAAESLAADSLYDVGDQPMGAINAHQAQDAAIGSLQEGAKQRNANHTTMDEIAKDTGGVAVYNTNAFNDALGRVADQGSYYYTLAYTPTNTASDGQFRKIQVKLSNGHYKLVYRNGYFAASPKSLATATEPPGDPLHPYMKPGTPDSSQIPLAVRVQPEPPQAGTKTPSRAGDNGNLQGPLTRYAVDFVIAARGLQLDPTPNGGHSGKIEAALVVYGQNGKPLNWMARQLDLTMDAARYAEVQADGVNFRLEIDVPKDSVSLRSGVFDRESNLAGTLEVPLTSVTSTLQAASSKSQ